MVRRRRPPVVGPASTLGPMGELDIPESRFVDLDGQVHYVEWEGPSERSFVLLHGLGGSYLSWVRVGRRLSEHGRVLALDLAGFALYRAPGIGEWVARKRLTAMSAERIVRLGFRIVAMNPATVPEELVRAHIDLLLERQKDPDIGPALVEAARSLLRLGERGDLARSVLDRAKCPVLVIHGYGDRLVPVAFAQAAIASHPNWRVRLLPKVGRRTRQ